MVQEKDMRRLPATGAALVTMLGAGAFAAPAAHAGVNPPVIRVSGLFGCLPLRTSVVGNPGDSFSIAVGDGCTAGGDTAETGGVVLSPGLFYRPGPGSVTLKLGSSGSGAFKLETFGFGQYHESTITVTVTTDEIPEGIVHDDLQQVGVPATGDCADVAEDVGHYPGAPIGGWSKSWAWWINDGKGGPVCTRELEELSDGTIVLIG